jgi:catechol 2,3-dioxygenase-like lactoylglutathione lyase family enzyme
MNDVGFTHVALTVRDPHASAAFYERFARMKVVHERQDSAGKHVLWLSDGTRPFVIVLIQVEKVENQLGGWNHLGVGCESREEVDRLCDLAKREGRLVTAPHDAGYPVGYWGMMSDPDGHNLEVAFGQEVGLTVERSSGTSSRPAP